MFKVVTGLFKEAKNSFRKRRVGEDISEVLFTILIGVGIFVLGLAFVLAIAGLIWGLTALLASWAWNSLVAPQFGLQQVPFWTMFGIIVLMSIVTGMLKNIFTRSSN